MAKRAIADEVRRFILTSVPSVPYLEALLLLRAEPHARWDPLTLARLLYIPESRALELLQAMAQSRIATREEDGKFAYSPESQKLQHAIDELAATYRQDLVGVTDLIHSRIDKRAQQFADAFRWNKDKK